MFTRVVVLGRSPQLSYQEYVSLYPDGNHVVLSPRVLVTDERLDCLSYLRRSGGVIKTARIIKRAPSIHASDIAEYIAQTLKDFTGSYGVSVYGRSVYPLNLVQEVKAILASRAIRSSYKLPKHDSELSTAQVGKLALHEFHIIPHGKESILAITDGIQDYEEWNKRDYGRPHSDPKRGMLPPKLARMMVNLAGADGEGKTLLDPFCGSGTILMEAACCRPKSHECL